MKRTSAAERQIITFLVFSLKALERTSGCPALRARCSALASELALLGLEALPKKPVLRSPVLPAPRYQRRR